VAAANSAASGTIAASTTFRLPFAEPKAASLALDVLPKCMLEKLSAAQRGRAGSTAVLPISLHQAATPQMQEL
jgi:hypothetical protein